MIVRQMFDISNFIRSLRLLRLELRGDAAECDWVARPPDQWDADLAEEVRERNFSLQALEDAMTVRELLFFTVPELSSAVLRVFRPGAQGRSELLITGTVSREEQLPPNVSSLTMRAKLSGFRFRLAD
jgi:hypothetical protein